MKNVARQIGCLLLALVAGFVVVDIATDLLGRAAAVPFKLETLRTWGGHAGLFGLLLMLSMLIPTTIAAFLIFWLLFKMTKYTNWSMVVAASLPWLWLFLEGYRSHLHPASLYVAVQPVIGIVCVPLAIWLAARLSTWRAHRAVATPD